MRFGWTLSRHVGWRTAKAILISFLVFIVLVSLIDFTQLARFIGAPGLDLRTAFAVSFLRGPSLAETVLPFAVLFGAMATFMQLNRRLELTVTRAAGVSAWQILLPACVTALVIGIFAVLVYNPGAVALRDYSVSLGGFGGQAFDIGGPVWLRQNGNDGPSIIGATRSAQDGTVLAGATGFRFDRDGTYRIRVDAPEAALIGNYWVFTDAVVTEVGAAPVRVDRYEIHTNLSPVQIRESLADPATVAFWRLPGLIEIATLSALPAVDLRMRFHTLLSLPALLVAMVLVAAVVSLRFSRTLNLARLIGSGAASGFVFYLLLVVSGDLGRGGVIAPAIAAWTPVLLATLVSVTVLLREEDG